MNGDRCPISCVFCQLYNVTDCKKFTKPFPKRRSIQFDEIYTFGNVFWWVGFLLWWILSSILGGGFCKLEPQEIVALFCNSNRCVVAELTFYFHKNTFEKKSWKTKFLVNKIVAVDEQTLPWKNQP